MEAFILVAAIMIILPLGFAFGIWLLLSWYRMRGQPQNDAPTFRPVDMELLWFPKTVFEKALYKPRAGAAPPHAAMSPSKPAD